MTRVVSSGTTNNIDAVFYDDAQLAPFDGASFTTFDDSQPPPQASSPGIAIDNDQASLAMTLFFPLEGVFPPRDGGDAGGSFIGEIGIFAGNFGPEGSPLAQGQLLSISPNTAVFSLLGTIYGSDGVSNFALPNLAGATMIRAGQGPGLSLQTEGAAGGSSSIVLISANKPPYIGGTSAPFDNHQPSLPINCIIHEFYVFPSPDGGGGNDDIGYIVPFAGNFAPSGWAFCDGSLLSIADNEVLFNLIGTTYGGDGMTTFALPDLRAEPSSAPDLRLPSGKLRQRDGCACQQPGAGWPGRCRSALRQHAAVPCAHLPDRAGNIPEPRRWWRHHRSQHALPWRDRGLCRKFRPTGVGAVRRPNPLDRPEHGTFQPSRHTVRRQRGQPQPRQLPKGQRRPWRHPGHRSAGQQRPGGRSARPLERLIGSPGHGC